MQQALRKGRLLFLMQCMIAKADIKTTMGKGSAIE